MNKYASAVRRLFVLSAAMLVACGSGHETTRHPVALAEARNSLTLDPSHYVVVIVRDQSTKTDHILVNGTPVDISNAYDNFHRDFDSSQTDAIIEAEPDVRYGTVLMVMASANAAGFTGFGLATRTVDSSVVGEKLTGFQKNINPKIHLAHDRNRANAQVEVVVTKTSVVWIDNKRTSLSGLYSAVAHTVEFDRKRSRSGAAPHIALTADTDTPWQTVVLILDAFRQSADDDVGFVTE